MRIALVSLALLVALAAPALADEQEEGWAYAVAREMMSPFCPGRTLADCPSPQADSLRMWIRLQEAAGRSREDVEAEIVERYGDVVLAAPRASGFGIAAYFIPAVAFVAGGVLVYVFLRRQTRGGGGDDAPPPSSGPSDPELERQLDEELARDARS